MLSAVEVAPTPCRRGTSNSDVRGNNKTRRERRQWLVDTYRADVDVIRITWEDETQTLYYPTDRAMFDAWCDVESDALVIEVEVLPACRCYRCGCLLHVGTVTADRIKPGIEGGKYSTPRRDRVEGRTNLRPACGDCNSETGGVLGAARKAATT